MGEIWSVVHNICQLRTYKFGDEPHPHQGWIVMLDSQSRLGRENLAETGDRPITACSQSSLNTLLKFVYKAGTVFIMPSTVVGLQSNSGFSPTVTLYKDCAPMLEI